MPTGRPPRLTPRLGLRLPLYLKAGVLEAAALCRTDITSLFSAAFEKLADPGGEGIEEHRRVETLGRSLADLYLGRLEDEKRLAVRVQDETNHV